MLWHEICIYSNDNNTATSTDIASYFNNKYSINIDRSTVSKILSTKDRWIDLNLESQETSVVRHRNVKFSFLEKVMTCWVEQMMGRGIILTELLIKEKAQEFAQLLEISEEELSFSNGWISRFKMRNHLRSFRFHGEANSAPLETLSEERNKL